MQNKLFLKAADICELLEVKQTSAYLVRVPYIKNISQLCFCLKEQHLIQVGGNKTAARTQYKVFNAAVFLPSINILYFHPLKMHTPNL